MRPKVKPGLMQEQGQGLPGLMHMHHPNNPPEMDLMQGQGQGLMHRLMGPMQGHPLSTQGGWVTQNQALLSAMPVEIRAATLHWQTHRQHQLELSKELLRGFLHRDPH